MPRPLLGAVPASSAPVPKGTAAPSKVEGAATSTSAERTAAAIEAEVEAGSGGSVDGAVDFLTLLPEDLGPDHILPLLDAPTCARCAAVSRRWRKQARLERLWRAHCQALWTGKAVRLNHESPWVRTAPPVNGIPTSEAVACPVLHGGASRADGLALTWFESYGASLESRGRIALTDHDLVCNDWLITFADATVAFLPPNLLAIILSDEEELRAKFDCATSGRRYTDGVFFRSHGPAEGHTAHWDIIDFGTRVAIPQAGAAGVLDVKRDPVTWQWSLEHEMVTMTSLSTTEVRLEGGEDPVLLALDGAPLCARKELTHVRWRHDSDSDSDDDE